MTNPRFQYTKDILADRIRNQGYEVGDWTYGVPTIHHWGEDATLRVGRFCSIANNVHIYLGGNHRVDWTTTYPFSALPEAWPSASEVIGHPATKGSVTIGNDVWLGVSSTILSGVEVGDGAVVGAAAVVTKDVKPFSIVAGNPARLIRYRFSEETVRQLLELRWWDWPYEKIQAYLPLMLSDKVEEFIQAASGEAKHRCVSAPDGLPADVANTVREEDHCWNLESPVLLTNLDRVGLLGVLPKGGEVAEVGVYMGGFATEIMRAAEPTRLHLIDSWGMDEDDQYAKAHGGTDWKVTLSSMRDGLSRVQQLFDKDISAGRVILYQQYSTAAAEAFPDHSLDWIYIDAAHDFQSVLSDLLAFKDKVKIDGFIGGHDFHGMLDPDRYGVIPAVREFTRSGEFQLVLLTNENYPSYLLARSGNTTTLPILRELLINNPACRLIEITGKLVDQLTHVQVARGGRKGWMMRIGTGSHEASRSTSVPEELPQNSVVDSGRSGLAQASVLSSSNEMIVDPERSVVEECASHSIAPLIKKIRDETGWRLTSCLDIGCGYNPANEWFQKIATGPDARYIGLETDRKIIDTVRERGIEVVHPFETELDLRSDLVLAKEVVEHIRVEDSAAFFEFCAKNTKRIFAMTTPNFEYWPGRRAADPNLRWIPDHLPGFRPESENPHHHKQEMTPAILQEYLAVAFPFPEWNVKVFRAWPWEMKDVARGLQWTLYFKVFALAWLA